MSDLDRPNIFIKIHKRKPSFGSESYERIQFERKWTKEKIDRLSFYNYLPATKMVWLCI